MLSGTCGTAVTRAASIPSTPRPTRWLGLKCYPAVADVAGEIELAVIVIPSQFVLEAIDECAKKGIRSVIVITAGFKESGAEGAALEKQLAGPLPRGRHPLRRPELPGHHEHVLRS